MPNDDPTGSSRRHRGLERFDEQYLDKMPVEEAPERTFEESAIGDVVNPLEQINSVFKRTASRLWLGVAGLTALVAAVVVWGFVAEQIVTTTAEVVLLPQSGLQPVTVLTNGLVEEVSVVSGQTVGQGEKLGVIAVPGGVPVTVTAPVSGTVVSVDTTSGYPITAGATFVEMAREGELTVAIGLLSPAAVGSVAEGQSVTIAIPTVNETRFGRMVGTVEYVANLPIAQGRVLELVGNAATATAILQSGPAYEIGIRLSRAETSSGFEWTVGDGPERAPELGTNGLAFVEVSRTSLASRAFD